MLHGQSLNPARTGFAIQIRENDVRKILLAALGLVFLPGLAMAEKGSGTDRDKVLLDVEAMRRDGRWDKAIAEGRANREAFEAQQRVLQRGQAPAAPGSTGRRPR